MLIWIQNIRSRKTRTHIRKPNIQPLHPCQLCQRSQIMRLHPFRCRISRRSTQRLSPRNRRNHRNMPLSPILLPCFRGAVRRTEGSFRCFKIVVCPPHHTHKTITIHIKRLLLNLHIQLLILKTNTSHIHKQIHTTQLLNQSFNTHHSILCRNINLFINYHLTPTIHILPFF